MDETQLDQLTKDIITKISPTLQPDKSMYHRMYDSIKWGLKELQSKETDRCYKLMSECMKGVLRIGKDDPLNQLKTGASYAFEGLPISDLNRDVGK